VITLGKESTRPQLRPITTIRKRSYKETWKSPHLEAADATTNAPEIGKGGREYESDEEL